MGNIRPKELSKQGYTDNMARSIAIETVRKHCKHHSQEQITGILKQIIQKPEAYKADAIWGKLAEVLSPCKTEKVVFNLHNEPISYRIYGADKIDKLAKQQMEVAMRLPVTIAGALMPDGCAGYGLPIGGILATTNDIVIPYAVGKDIG